MAFLTKAPGKGTFTTLTVGGTKVPAINQEKLEDCGPSCIGLVLRMTKYKNADAIPSAWLRAASQASSGLSYSPAAADVGGVKGAPQPLAAPAQIMNGSVQKDRSTGTYGNNLAATLSEQYGYASAASKSSAAIKDLLRGAALAKPFIVNVVWENGGGHWVVCCGHKGAFIGHGSYLFSDPYFGVGWIEIPRETVNGGIKQPS